MVNHGKEIFQDYVPQLMTIIVSLALAIVAKQLSGDIANTPLIPFITDHYGLIFNSEHLSILHNVLIPFIMYLFSCGLLLWMGITNLVTYNETGAKSLMFLKILLGFFQLLLFGILIFFDAKLFSYFMLLVFTVIILVDILNYAASFHEVETKHK
ncbi:hypothetical protein [Aquibacillus saliphilus]|uniref:hypothetical protein n=1 Tax=Aquibacillus saliphilus TaxID=1909422 RepID=UPI001CF026F8|nr:hypothetical protein [Aquibacillus saliphilus]